ncbi:MAG: hypothetical protein ACRENO_03195, partial [Thermodesulfobacteriota bacterium]
MIKKYCLLNRTKLFIALFIFFIITNILNISLSEDLSSDNINNYILEYKKEPTTDNSKILYEKIIKNLSSKQNTENIMLPALFEHINDVDKDISIYM